MIDLLPERCRCGALLVRWVWGNSWECQKKCFGYTNRFPASWWHKGA